MNHAQVRSDAPIFIVGNPRSGSTLLASLLDRHEVFASGPETHFFEQLGRPKLRWALRHWPTGAAEAVCSLEVHEVPVHESFGIHRSEILDHLGSRQPSVQAMLESLTNVNADRHGATRWVEKTPGHVRHLEAIRALYPRAIIVESARHPVASAHGMCSLPWASASPVANSYLIREWSDASEEFLRSDPGVVSIRYEDLVDDPTRHLMALFDRLGEEFDPSVIDRPGGDHLIEPGASWKRAANGPLDTDIGRRWERDADPLACAVISSICAGYRQRHGYEAIGSPEPTRHHVIGFDWSIARRLPDDLDRLASRGMAVEPEADAGSTAPVAAPGVTGLRKALWFVGRALVAARGRRRISLLTGHGVPTTARRLLVRTGVVREVRLEHFMSCDEPDGGARRGSV